MTLEDAAFDPEPLRTKAAKRATRPRRRPESDIVAEVISYIRALPFAYARKVHGSQFGNAGEPDVDAVVRGRSVKLEGKALDGGHPTAVQLGALRRWEKAGALVGWFTCLADVQKILDHVENYPREHKTDLDYPGCSCPQHQNISG